MASSAAVIGTEQPDFYYSDRSLHYLDSILAHSRGIVSVYVGLEDGTFRQVRRIDPRVEIQGKLPPPGTRTANRWILRLGNGTIVDRYEFRDASGRVLGVSEAPTTYDPRVRGWYRRTAEARSTFVTDPDVFSALSLIGFTVAAPFFANEKVLGVAAV